MLKERAFPQQRGRQAILDIQCQRGELRQGLAGHGEHLPQRLDAGLLAGFIQGHAEPRVVDEAQTVSTLHRTRHAGPTHTRLYAAATAIFAAISAMIARKRRCRTVRRRWSLKSYHQPTNLVRSPC